MEVRDEHSDVLVDDAGMPHVENSQYDLSRSDIVQVGMFLGHWTAFPINWWLIKKNIKEPCA